MEAGDRKCGLNTNLRFKMSTISKITCDGCQKDIEPKQKYFYSLSENKIHQPAGVHIETLEYHMPFLTKDFCSINCLSSYFYSGKT